MKVVVTGGGGFVGRHIVERLVRRGDEVIAISRHNHPEVEALGATSVAMDIRQRQQLVELFRGVEEVHHTAALAGIWGGWQDYHSINVIGTENVIFSCLEQGVQRLIFTSSPSVVFAGEDQKGVDESTPYPSHWLSHYSRSKMMSEMVVLEANGRDGGQGILYTTALRPHLIWGPGDRHLVPRLIDRARRGKLVQVGNGTNRVDVVHVCNVAEAHLGIAAQMGSTGRCNGKAYFISQGEPVLLWGFINSILNRAGLPPIKRTISFGAAYNIGAAMEWLYRLTNRRSEPRMTRFLAYQLATNHYYDISRAKQDFGYRPLVSTEQGLATLFDEDRTTN